MLSLVVLGLAAAASAANIDVTVGAGGLVYTPNNFSAAKGDVVVFHFSAGAHSVSQSSVDAPCVELQGGFDSGFANITALGGPQTWSLTIDDDTKPIWFYCKQGNHCQSGMAGAINAPAGKLDTYIAAAQAVPLVKQTSSLVQQGVGASATSGFVADSAASAAPSGSAPYGGSGSSPTGAGTGAGASPAGTGSASPAGTGSAASPSGTAPPDNAAFSQRAASAGAVAIAVVGAAVMVL